MFEPRSVAVIGASRDPRRIGRRLFDAIIAGGFRGPVYPINRNAEAIGNLRAYSSIGAVPGPVDLALIAVPRDSVLLAAAQCADAGVPAIIVITAGFAETDDTGRRLQQELLDCVRGHGMRMLGPNCLGLLNTDGENPLNALFVSVSPPVGNVAMSSDSGALGLAVLQGAARLGLGISTCVSVGNRADVSSNDLLEYWE
jgi:acyl-CoA synthetase (NDP forming)